MKQLTVLVGVALVVGIGHAQSSDQKPPAFEVASIKPNVGGLQSGMRQFRGGRYVTRYATLKDLIGHAYGVGGRSLSDRRVIGAPTWLTVDRFDIEATAPGIPDDSRGMVPAAVELRIRSLLEERCALVTHLEQRELPLYALVLVHRDGHLGPAKRRRTTPCLSAAASNGTIAGKHMTCGGRVQPGCGEIGLQPHVRAQRRDDIIEKLGEAIDKFVVVSLRGPLGYSRPRVLQDVDAVCSQKLIQHHARSERTQNAI